LRKAAAERDFEAAKLRVTNEVMALAGEVRTAFYQAQANKQFVEMLQQVVEATGTGVEVAERLRKAGNITELALYQRKALHQESRLALAAVEAAFMDSRERLNAMMGVWGTATRWSMNTRLPEIPDREIDVTTIEKQAIESNLELEMMRLQMEALAKRAGIVNVTSVIPDLEIGFRWERSEDGDWEDGPSISFPIPIFDFGQAKRARARAQLEQVRANYKDLAIRIRSAARGAARGLEMARMKERHLREVMLPLRERIIEGLMLEYNAMQIGVFRLLMAQEQQLLTGQRYIDALREYWLARGRVELIVNGRMASAAPMAKAMPAAGGGDSEGGH
jgi:cobalt-zinc-cadmium efflux system outer membrane protein